jgi:hypothetical protein
VATWAINRPDHFQRLGQRLARVNEHVAAHLDARVVVGAADLRRGGVGDERHRAIGIVYPSIGWVVRPRRGAGPQAAVTEPGVGAATAVELQGQRRRPRWRPGRQITPRPRAHHEDPNRRVEARRGPAAHVLVKKGDQRAVEIDQRLGAEVDLPQPA